MATLDPRLREQVEELGFTVGENPLGILYVVDGEKKSTAGWEVKRSDGEDDNQFLCILPMSDRGGQHLQQNGKASFLLINTSMIAEIGQVVQFDLSDRDESVSE